MPKNLSLFGAWLQRVGKAHRTGFKKSQITKPIPVKAYGRSPSAASQMSLWGQDDFNYFTRKRWSGRWTRKTIYPLNYRKDFHSENLNTTIHNLRVTPSALYTMDDAGGFDNYIMRTPPEELRSATGEKMREVMYFYMKNPHVRAWGLPWKVFLRARNRADPEYARYAHEAKKEASASGLAQQHARFSPYYLPTKALLHPARQEFMEGSQQPELNLWWRDSPALEAAFRRRLTEAKSFERAHADHREPMGFRLGGTMGGGGPKERPRKRSKTHRYRHIRPFG
jgi:large subunit ribosomal protein L28